MNKNAIKTYAIWARSEMISRVAQKAYEYGVTKDNLPEPGARQANGKILSDEESRQLAMLVSKVREHGYVHVMEEVAYTWFNRFIALRFMEVNNYLPQKVRPFTDEENKFNPQLITDALDLDFVDKNTIYSYKDRNDTDGLYKYLVTSLCNDMNNYLPDMFTPITDYKALLMPDHLLNDGSVLDRLIKDIPEEDWTDHVQIIGWLYQYYNSELKDIVMKKKEYTKDDIPAATQLFTPDWIVRYMVENSLGRLWVDGHPSFKYDQWKYYLEEAEQEPEVLEQLNAVKQEHARIKPEEIKVIDPCMGSGHILVYAFDVLMDIYRDNGYSDRDAARSIVENNIYGIEIDERAYQLAYFAIMMKARSYNRRILNENIRHNLVEIIESNNIKKYLLRYLGEYEETGRRLVDLFKDAKEFGSLINVDIPVEILDRFDERLTEVDRWADYGNLLVQAESIELVDSLSPIVKEARMLAQKYDVVVTNPPYMAPSPKQKPFVQQYYPDSKTDLFAVFIEKCNEMLSDNSFASLVTMQSWMFLSSYEKFREKVLNYRTITNLLHMDNMVMGIAFGTAVSIYSNSYPKKYIGTYNQVIHKNIIGDNPCEFPVKGNRFSQISQDNFRKIPGSPIAYWLSKKVFGTFMLSKLSNSYFSAGRNKTHNNEKYTRLGWEISDKTKWQPYDKGGSYRKWYGNHEYVVDWSDDAKKEYDSHGGLYNQSYSGKYGIEWSLITSGSNSFRIKEKNHHYDSGSPTIMNKQFILDYRLLGYLNSKVAKLYLQILNPTLNMGNTYVLSLPYLCNEDELIDRIVYENISLSKEDWDSYETSWDFTVSPLIKQLDSLWDATGIGATIHSYYGHHIKVNSDMELCYHLWKIECNERFKQLKENEEDLNRIFIDIYGLNDELTPEVEDKDVTVHYVVDNTEDVPESLRGSKYVRTMQDEVKSFISYAVGCMFGRYSFDVKGLAYAGGEWDDNKYRTFIPDRDNIIPICDDDFFEDDIAARFIRFVEAAYGKDGLEDNLQFIADALGGKGTAREVIREYFVKQFFADHCNTYQVTGSGKRPIYWLFDSGKKNGFKALIYMHRYTPDLLAKMRTDYVHEQQERYRTQIENLESEILNMSGAERIKAEKKLNSYYDKLAETASFEEKLHHLADQMISIDLDDGFKENYPKFEDVVAKVK